MATLTFHSLASPARFGFPYTEVAERRANASGEPEQGAWHSYQINERPIRRMRLAWNEAAGEGSRYRVLDLWDQSISGVLPMNFTRPGDADVDAIEVRFSQEPRIAKVQGGGGYYRIEVELEEVL